MTNMQPTSTGGVASSLCGGCQRPIVDRYVYHVGDQCWHGTCIACVDCRLPLADKCYTRHGYIYCRDDFAKYAL